MFLNEEEQSKISKNKSSESKKRKKRKINNKYNKKFLKNYNINNDEQMSLIEHQNILNEYKEEMNFLNMKRKKADTQENFDNNNEMPKDKSNIIICVNNNESSKNSDKENFNGKEKKGGAKNDDLNMKISKLYYIYHYLFKKSGLNCDKPSKIVDYLSNEIENNNNFYWQKKTKVNYYDIKTLMHGLENKDKENVLINKLIKEYYHCSFKNSTISKLIKKINKIIVNKNKSNNEMKYSDNLTTDINSLSINTEILEKNSKAKKDSYSNLLDEKLKNNNYESCLSLTSDSEYFKSIIYLNNKYVLNNRKYTPDKNIVKSLEANKDLLKSFKENREKAQHNERKYLKNLIKNKKLKKYINKKFFYFKESFKNPILKILNENNFNEIINILISSEIEEKEKLKSINDLHHLKKVKKNDISNFISLLYFVACITMINKNKNLLLKSDLALLTQLFQYFNDISTQSKIKTKKEIKVNQIKKKNKNNKIKIRIDSDSENEPDSLIDSPQNNTEECKNEEVNKEEQNKILNIILNNNNSSFYDENQNNKTIKNNKTSNPNGFLYLKLPSSTEDNSFIKNDKNTNNNYSSQNNPKCNLINENASSNYQRKNKNQKKFKKKFRLFHERILKELSLGKDIFKLNYVKIREREKTSKNEEFNKEIEKDSEIKIEIEKEKIINDEKIINENNYNNKEKQLLKKEGNKIIIYGDYYSEENEKINDENNGNNN